MLYCTSCGKQIESGSRYCPSCGTPVAASSASNAEADHAAATAAGVPPPPPASGPFVPRMSRLVRPRHPRAIAGVCAAFALRYGWDLVLVRVVTAVVALTTGVGLIAYIIGWIAIPEGQYALPPDAPYR